MAPNYVVPPNASLAHRAFAQYINSWNPMDLDALAETMDDEKFMWSMFPTSINIPPLSKAQALQGELVTKLGNVLKNEYLMVLNFVPSKIEGELPKISTYMEFMDSKAVMDWRAAEAKSKADAAAK
ncbi:hypothetical protein BDZ89DRAFT_1071989 [Hymenopellis radicata]|nr:hypothetical protein BDZ89DRAFT_1071989 [Hymenopellis radicata]